MDTPQVDPRRLALARVLTEVFPQWPNDEEFGVMFFVDRTRLMKGDAWDYHDRTQIFARVIVPGVNEVDSRRDLTPEQHVRVALAWEEDPFNQGMTVNIPFKVWAEAWRKRNSE